MIETSIASVETGDGHRLYDDYRPFPGVFDEMFARAGELRPHWEYIIRSLAMLGEEDLARRRSELMRLLRENGVTYNVYEDPGRGERLWALDSVPVPMPSADWAVIEQGLIQRAELLDLVLADLYGPRKLLQKGLLPPEVVFAHPGFLRPCDGLTGAGSHRLLLYGADLARAPGGGWTVLGDRTQAPSGAGYALENRTVLANVFPSLYRDARVHRLALFFRALRARLGSLDPYHRDNPRIVVLTPGPDNETYFEHAFLASYLGYLLVQGSDLTVRDGRVWLKALDGLKAVDVILRRVDDAYCDPLELRSDSLLGVAGILQAARLGHVTVANSLGSSVLDNPGLMPFLPGLARELLGEDLRLPSVATWWCGQERECAYVLEHLEEMVVKPIVPHRAASTVFGPALMPDQRDELRAAIRARPHLYVGQERISLSTTPVLTNGRLEPRRMLLRSFLVASDDGYVVMPGGLCRVAPGAETWVVSNQYGGISKDVWVLASEPERHVTLLTTTEPPLAVTRDGDEVPGRIADDLFWLGRYVERVEGASRLLREVLPRTMGAERADLDDSLPVLLRAVTHATGTYPGFVGEGAEARLGTPEVELLGVILDRHRAGSVRADIDAVVRTARAVRDRLSSDTFRIVSRMNRELVRPCDLAAGRESLRRLVTLLAAFQGLAAESMSRGQGWRFLEIGRRVERALQTIALLRSTLVFAPSSTPSLLEALLAVAHCLKTYHRRYRSRLQVSVVLDLLVLDETNPRSVGFQVAQLETLVAALAGGTEPRRSAAERLVLEASTRLRLFDSTGLDDPAGGRESIDSLLTRVASLLMGLSDELTLRYFGQAETPHQLVCIS